MLPLQAYCYCCLLFSLTIISNRPVSGRPDECRKVVRPATEIQKTPGDNGFRLKISPSSGTYAPGHNYTITLHGWRTLYSVQKFVGFWIRAVPRDGRIRTSSAGKFEQFNDAFVTYSGQCSNIVTNRTSMSRPDIEMIWRAPKHGSGCIQIRATVVEYKNIWYQEEGGLIKELCEEEQADQEQLPEQVHEGCQACDDAKYELLFTGIWSPQTHPKDFPTTQWFTHFSDIIGATHTADLKIYEIGGYASDGLRQLAEWGKTTELEKELKTKTKNVRTIVKARGLWYPNLNGQTHAVFRTDKKHHLLSLASMFGPSPDWLVGVDSLNLCLKNRSWVDRVEVDLYPFDAGTDSGETYMSANLPTEPREKIQNITINHPKNPNSPFFDQSGNPMKSLAKLVITNLKIYERACDDPKSPVTSEEVIDTTSATRDDARMECAVSDWSAWTACSGPCGQGSQMRTRTYRDPAKATMHSCTTTLLEKQMCSQACDSGSAGNSNADVNCMITPWSPWSGCSVTCGTGLRFRSRMFKDPMGEKFCTDTLMEKEQCSIQDCNDGVARPSVSCMTSDWSDWSACSETCGPGLRVRSRMFKEQMAEKFCGEPLMEKEECTVQSCDVHANFNFNCMTSPWSPWSSCSATCGVGERTRSRTFKEPLAERVCSEAVMEKEECRLPDCDPHTAKCTVTNWSKWSPCSVTCGKGTQARRRQYMYPRDATACQVTLTEKRGCIANRTSCDIDPMEQKVVCMQPKQVGSCYGFMPRWHFDAERGVCQPFVYSGCRGNQNNFENYEDCNRACERALEDIQGIMSNSIEPMYFSQMTAQLPSAMIRNGMICAPLPTAGPSSSSTTTRQHNGPSVDCQVTTWSSWTPCSVTCGRGFQDRYRQVVVRPQNGGSGCPSKMDQRRRCIMPTCKNQHCVLGDWTVWMQCTQSCGEGMQQRIRMIKHLPPTGAHACAYVPVETRKCPDLPPCNDNQYNET